MGGIRRLIGWAFAGVLVCVGLLVGAPAGSAADAGARLQPLAPAAPAPLLPEPPPSTLILVPATAAAGTLVTVVGERFAACAATHSEIESSSRGGASAAAAGEVSLLWDGAQPLTIVHLDAQSGFSANVQIAESAPPGDHWIAGRCNNTAGDGGGAAVTVTPPPTAAAVAPSTNPVDVTAASPTAPVAEAALAAPGVAVGRGMAVNQPPPADIKVPAEKAPSRAIAAEPASPGAGPASLGPLVAALGLVGAALIIPSLIPVVLQARRGQKWVRTNVRAVANVAPAASGSALAPRIDDFWPPTSVVKFALHADRGTQVLTEDTEEK